MNTAPLLFLEQLLAWFRLVCVEISTCTTAPWEEERETDVNES